MKINKVLFLSLFLFTFLIDMQAQWVSIGSGLQDDDLAIWSLSVIDENTVWATAWDKGNEQPAQYFTRTTDVGATWHPGTVPMPAEQYGQHIFALDSLTAWVAAANFTLTNGGIYKTIDGGLTWEHQNTAYANPGTGPHAVHFFDENNGFTFGFGFNYTLKAYFTTDGGTTWESATVPAPNPSELVEFNIGNGMYETIGDTAWFVTNQARVFRSINRGQDWQVVGKAFVPTPEPDSGPNSIAFKDAQHGIVVSYWPPEAAVTSDGGATWVNLPNFPTTDNVIQVEYVPGTDNFITHGGYGFNQNTKILKICNFGDTTEQAGSTMNVDVLQFISSETGFGGDYVISPEEGGIYKWDGNMDCSVVSTKEYEVFPLTISPNPTRDHLNVLLPENATNNLHCRIFNLQGKEVHYQILQLNEKVQLNELNPGMYLIEIMVEDKVYVGKVIVN